MTVWQAAVTFAGAAVLSAVGSDLVRRVAPRMHLLDLPNERSLHLMPKPRGGGLAIVVVCAAGIGGAAVAGLRPSTAVEFGYLAGAVLIAVVSAVDDVRSLPASLRLAVQCIAALGVSVTLAFGPSALAGAPVAIAVAAALVWTVGLTNAYNFMDGSDGLVGAQGVVAGIAWAILATVSGQVWLALIGILVAGACLGFLTMNWAPARIFLGDVGSAFLGFSFAFLALAVPRHPAQMVAGVVVVWPLLFDASVTFIRRLVRRENVFAAHRSHLYQRMVLAGWDPGRVAALYAILSLVAAGSAVVLWAADSTLVRILVVLVVFLESVGLWALTAKVEQRRVAVAAGTPRA